MIHLVTFEVLGVPAPQGSKTRMPNGAVVEGSSTTGRAKHKSWRAAVVETARDIAATPDPDDPLPYDAPLQLQVEFRLPMPQSRPKWMRDVGLWPHAVKPDLDKLVRGLLDGLTVAGLVRDDSRFFAIDATAWEVWGGWQGAEVTLRRWET